LALFAYTTLFRSLALSSKVTQSFAFTCIFEDTFYFSIFACKNRRLLIFRLIQHICRECTLYICKTWNKSLKANQFYRSRNKTKHNCALLVVTVAPSSTMDTLPDGPSHKRNTVL